MFKDLHSKAKNLSSAAARGCRQLSKARVIDSDKVIRLWDEWERRGSKNATRTVAREKKKQAATRQPALRTKSKRQL